MADNKKLVIAARVERIDYETLARCYDVVGYDEKGPIYRIKPEFKSKSLKETVGYFLRGLLP